MPGAFRIEPNALGAGLALAFMAHHNRAVRGTGPKYWRSAGTLFLVTGALDHVWQPLDDSDDRYALFLYAFEMQEAWDWREHSAYWSTHIGWWPRVANRGTRTGVIARAAATWLRAGYSHAQIEQALEYARDAAPRTLWTLAHSYADWLREEAPFLKVGGPAAVEALEEAFVRGAGIQAGKAPPADLPYILTDDPSLPGDVEGIRGWVRRRWRTPRVVDTDTVKFGMPEPYSTGLLYSEIDTARIERAEVQLVAQPPYHQNRDAV